MLVNILHDEVPSARDDAFQVALSIQQYLAKRKTRQQRQ